MLKYFVSLAHKVNVCQAKRFGRFFFMDVGIIMGHLSPIVKCEFYPGVISPLQAGFLRVGAALFP
jgi:hypothetical protein